MIKISSEEAKFLREHGYGRMITVVNKGHRGRQKTHYLNEQANVMEFYRQHFATSK